jgi:hypothetical protein
VRGVRAGRACGACGACVRGVWAGCVCGACVRGVRGVRAGCAGHVCGACVRAGHVCVGGVWGGCLGGLADRDHPRQQPARPPRHAAASTRPHTPQPCNASPPPTLSATARRARPRVHRDGIRAVRMRCGGRDERAHPPCQRNTRNASCNSLKWPVTGRNSLQQPTGRSFPRRTLCVRMCTRDARATHVRCTCVSAPAMRQYFEELRERDPHVRDPRPRAPPLRPQPRVRVPRPGPSARRRRAARGRRGRRPLRPAPRPGRRRGRHQKVVAQVVRAGRRRMRAGSGPARGGKARAGRGEKARAGPVLVPGLPRGRATRDLL